MKTPVLVVSALAALAALQARAEPGAELFHSFERYVTELKPVAGALYPGYEEPPLDATRQGGYALQARRHDRATLVPIARDGKYGLQLQTTGGDSGMHSSGEHERTEISLSPATTGAREGVEQWWAHSLYLAKNFQMPDTGPLWSWSLLMQFHASPGGNQPHFSLEIVYEGGNPPRLVMRARSQGGPGERQSETVQYTHRVLGGNPNPVSGEVLVVNPKKELWYDFVHHIRWTSGKTGFHEIWLREGDAPRYRKVLDKHGIATLYPGQVAYLKLGTYHVTLPNPPGAVIHDRVVRGTSAAAVRMAPMDGVP
jgi:hypothetical protein